MPVSQVVSKKLEDEALQFAIARGMNKKFRTVKKWVKENEEILTSKAVVLIIKEETGLSEDEILVGEKATA